MPNVAQVLKLEMKRIAAREIRSTGLAARVKEQARQIRGLQRRLKALEARPAAVVAPAPPAETFEPTPPSLKALRARLGLTQPGLARLVGVSASAVTKWETGKIRPGGKSARVLGRLATRAAETHGEAHQPAPAGKGRRFKASPAAIKAIRARLGVTQSELARLLGVSHSAVYQWEAGRITPRGKAVSALQALKAVGKREAKTRLAAE